MLISLIGEIITALGLLMLCTILIKAKRDGSFEAIKELKRIRSKGYITEHKEEHRENIYKREFAASQAEKTTRRARRVLERMRLAEEKGEKKPGTEKGSTYLEVVSAGPDKKKTASQNRSQKPDTEDGTAILRHETDKTEILSRTTEHTGILTETDTDLLPSENDTDILVREPNTDVLKPEEKTDILKDTEGTDVLLPETGTDILIKENPDDTDILERNTDGDTDLLPENIKICGSTGDHECSPASEEATALLPEEPTMLLGRSENERTALLNNRRK